MTRKQESREDLLREASVFPNRMLLRLEAAQALAALGSSAPDSNAAQEPAWELFLGQRTDRSLSIYFSQDFVLQFNAHQQLRRLFWIDQKMVADNGHLHRLDRENTSGRVAFRRVALEAAREQSILMQCHQVLRTTYDALESNTSVEYVGSVDKQNKTAWQDMLQPLLLEIKVADQPGLG